MHKSQLYQFYLLELRVNTVIYNLHKRCLAVERELVLIKNLFCVYIQLRFTNAVLKSKHFYARN